MDQRDSHAIPRALSSSGNFGMWYSRAKVVVDGESPFRKAKSGQRFAGFVDRNSTVPYKAVMRLATCSQVFILLHLCSSAPTASMQQCAS